MDELFSTLDLHGETAASARRRAERWLREHRADGIRQVRIVTGRGLHSAGAAVLPGEIGELLAELRGTVVSRFESEPGGGAYRVELRPPERPPPPPPRPALRDVDPALRRAAEESLRELGVDPTPALVDAELRRMRREGS